MSDQPYEGRIVIDWRRVAGRPPDDFDWRVTPEPAGLLTDEEISRLLVESRNGSSPFSAARSSINRAARKGIVRELAERCDGRLG